MMGLRESLIITEFISNETHLFRNNPTKPMDNLYILSSILSSRMKLSLPVSTNIIEILIEILKKKNNYLLLRNRRKNETGRMEDGQILFN